MGIPQVAFGRYPSAPRQTQASIPDYSRGIDKFAEAAGTVKNVHEAYDELVRKKAAAIQARQIADAKQLEDERSSKARETETQRAHQETEKERDRQFKMKEREEANEASAANDFYQKVEKDPSILKNATRYAAEMGASRARFGIKPSRPINPPGSTNINIRAGQEREQAKAQIPPLKAELAKINAELEEAKATVPTRSKFKKVQDPAMPFMTKDSLMEVPDERDQRAIVKFIEKKKSVIMEKYRNAHSKSGTPFPVEETYPTAPEIDSLNPAGLNLPTR